MSVNQMCVFVVLQCEGLRLDCLLSLGWDHASCCCSSRVHLWMVGAVVVAEVDQRHKTGLSLPTMLHHHTRQVHDHQVCTVLSAQTQRFPAVPTALPETVRRWKWSTIPCAAVWTLNVRMSTLMGKIARLRQASVAITVRITSVQYLGAREPSPRQKPSAKNAQSTTVACLTICRHICHIGKTDFDRENSNFHSSWNCSQKFRHVYRTLGEVQGASLHLQEACLCTFARFTADTALALLPFISSESSVVHLCLHLQSYSTYLLKVLIFLISHLQ